MNIKIISEDDYGGAFFKNVIAQLRYKKMVDNITLKASKPMRPLCNLKLDRILKAFDTSCEWICISKNLKWKHSKPSEELKINDGYIKSRLPKYGNELNFDLLRKNCRSYRVFLDALTSK